MSVILEAVRGWRPGFFLDDQFDGLGTGATLRVVPVADAEEGIAVFGEQSFGPFLSRFQLNGRSHEYSSSERIITNALTGRNPCSEDGFKMRIAASAS